MNNNVKKWAPALLMICGLALSALATGRPAEKFELPDWSKTPVEDRDLGHGVHMLESFGATSACSPVTRAYCWLMPNGLNCTTRSWRRYRRYQRGPFATWSTLTGIGIT